VKGSFVYFITYYSFLNLDISLPGFAAEEPGTVFKEQPYHTPLKEVLKILKLGL